MNNFLHTFQIKFDYKNQTNLFLNLQGSFLVIRKYIWLTTRIRRGTWFHCWTCKVH